jgi:hypothetical protein
MRSDTAEAERAEGGAVGSNAVVPGAQERGRSTLPSRAAAHRGHADAGTQRPRRDAHPRLAPPIKGSASAAPLMRNQSQMGHDTSSDETPPLCFDDFATASVRPKAFSRAEGLWMAETV